MPQRPVVDVVIPTYNRLSLLPGAIESILAQTWPVNRIIVADDGSNDGTAEWLLAAANENRRIEPLILQNGGANRARNAGIAAAKAEWIAFLDSDDAWEPDKLERQFALLDDAPDLVGLFTGFRLVGGAIARQHIPRRAPSLEDLRCANVLGGTSSAVLRADALRQIGGFDPSLPSCQDWDLWFRLRQVGAFGLVRAPLVRFNVGPHERITSTMHKVLTGHEAIFGRLLEGIGSRAQRHRIRAGHRLVQADIRCRFGDYGTAIRLAAGSLLARPSPSALRIAWRSLRGGMGQLGRGRAGA